MGEKAQEPQRATNQPAVPSNDPTNPSDLQGLAEFVYHRITVNRTGIAHPQAPDAASGTPTKPQQDFFAQGFADRLIGYNVDQIRKFLESVRALIIDHESGSGQPAPLPPQARGQNA